MICFSERRFLNSRLYCRDLEMFADLITIESSNLKTVENYLSYQIILLRTLQN